MHYISRIDVTVDFPTFAGNARNCNEGLTGTQGEITLNGSTRSQGETVTSQSGTRDQTTNWIGLQ